MEENKLTKVQSHSVQTGRILVSYDAAGSSQNPPLVLIHGNVSSRIFWEGTIESLAERYQVFAPDLRGYGETEAKPIDATRGLRDWSNDLKSFLDSLQLTEPVHLLGWSLGGGIAMQFAIDYPEHVRSIILSSSMSPFGFGGTKDVEGTPCYPNFAGSGGGTANPEFVASIASNDTGTDKANSPRNVLNQFYFKPLFKAEVAREDRYVASMNLTRTGEGYYPGSFEGCEQWPGVAPGADGINNALSPKYVDLSPLIHIERKRPILWIRGADDAIVSDQSLFDFGTLGKLGYVPGWPGDDVFPSQPMISQLRYVLDRYQAEGGAYTEAVSEDCGHSPHIEQPEAYLQHVNEFLQKN
jgi:pimeloyl-ACP methyl ester carboxylesterase